MPKKKYWIAAADKAGKLPAGALRDLEAHLVPNGEGRLITLPADTWQGMWKLMHMHKALAEREKE